MKKLLLTAAALISVANLMKAEEPTPYDYDKELTKVIIFIMQQDSFMPTVRKCTAGKESGLGGRYVACLQSLVMEELKKEKNKFDEIEAMSFVVDCWMDSALETMAIKIKDNEDFDITDLLYFSKVNVLLTMQQPK